MHIAPIRAEKEYREALRIIEGLMLAEAGTPEGDQLEVLAILVEDYERRHYPLDQPDPLAPALKPALPADDCRQRQFKL
jgi:HTH-type transcriptional regulator/antitoxin HigA